MSPVFDPTDDIAPAPEESKLDAWDDDSPTDDELYEEMRDELDDEYLSDDRRREIEHMLMAEGKLKPEGQAPETVGLDPLRRQADPLTADERRVKEAYAGVAKTAGEEHRDLNAIVDAVGLDRPMTERRGISKLEKENPAGKAVTVKREKTLSRGDVRERVSPKRSIKENRKFVRKNDPTKATDPVAKAEAARQAEQAAVTQAERAAAPTVADYERELEDALGLETCRRAFGREGTPTKQHKRLRWIVRNAIMPIWEREPNRKLLAKALDTKRQRLETLMSVKP